MKKRTKRGDKPQAPLAYVINLPACVDKRRAMESQLAALPFRATFINAVSPADFDKHRFLVNGDFFDPLQKTSIRNGEVGCSLSHWHCWELFAASGEEAALILEDDVIIDATNIQDLLSTLQKRPVDADIVYLKRKPLNEVAEQVVDDSYLAVKASYWTCAYLLTKKGAQALLNSGFKEALIVVDEFLPILYDQSYLQQYAAPYGGTTLKAYALRKGFIELAPQTALDSQTFHSPFFPVHNYVAITIVDGCPVETALERWKASCQKYGIKPLVVASESMLREELASCTTPVFLTNYRYGYFIGNPKEYVSDGAMVAVLSSLADDYFYFGPAEQALSQTASTEAPPWLIRLQANETTRVPDAHGLFLYGQQNQLLLNAYENYLHGTVYSAYGFKYPLSVQEWTSRVRVCIMGCPSIEQLRRNISELRSRLQYPAEYLEWVVYNQSRIDIEGVEIHTVPNVLSGFEDALKARDGFDHVLLFDGTIELQRGDVLRNLLRTGKPISSALFRKDETYFSNMWGALTPDGWYQRSDDYIDIVEGQRVSLWNVPYVSGCVLFRSDFIRKHDIFASNGLEDPWMRICHNLRASGEGIYFLNDHRYGAIQDEIMPQPDFIAQAFPGWGVEDVFSPEILGFIRAFKGDYSRIHQISAAGLDSYQSIATQPFVAVGDDIWNFPLFTEKFCDSLIARAESANQWSKGYQAKKDEVDSRIGAVENIPTQDVHLFQLNLHDFWAYVTEHCLAKILSYLYFYKAEKYHIAFVVRYTFEEGGQTALKGHHDACAYTINVALNGDDQYTGGGVLFPTKGVLFKNTRKGFATLHPGRVSHYHEALPITSGRRYILVSFNQ